MMKRDINMRTIDKAEQKTKVAIESLKNELSGYAFICRTIKKLHAEILELGNLVKSERDTRKAIVYWGSEGQKSNAIVDPTADAVSNIIDKYEAQIVYVNQKLKDLYDKKNQTEKKLENLEEFEYKLIELRYFKKQRWDEVARAIEYSERHCRRMNQAILNKLVEN